MPRPKRLDNAGQIYHVLNRANARLKIFDQQIDYVEYLQTLSKGLKKFKVDVYVFIVMPNHWHIICSPQVDGELSKLMHWVTMTHTQRWHSRKGTRGSGHFYQGRFKSFLIQDDGHFLQVCRYVERNALRAGLVNKAENWKWSSLFQRRNNAGIVQLSKWPIDIPRNYLNYLNESQSENELVNIRKSVNKQKPFGDNNWLLEVISKYGLQSTVRDGGRPKRENRS